MASSVEGYAVEQAFSPCRLKRKRPARERCQATKLPILRFNARLTDNAPEVILEVAKYQRIERNLGPRT